MTVQAGSQLGDRLAACAATRALTLSPLTADALHLVFLPALLPGAWQGQHLVSWRQEGALTAEGITSDWLKRLWGVLLQLPDMGLLSLWPLVPVQGDKLCRPHPAAQVTPDFKAPCSGAGCPPMNLPAIFLTLLCLPSLLPAHKG